MLARITAAAEGSDAGDRPSRVDLAATVLGDSHALDCGSRTSTAITRALALLYGGSGREGPWTRAGVNLDRVSAPVLAWGLVVDRSEPLADLLHAAIDLGVPIHLSQLALRRHPVQVAAGVDILVTENPRLVEAACEHRTDYPVVALNGNPSGAARLLVAQLLRSGAALRYHGDFDSVGLRICARMHRLGLVPWHMGTRDYLDAVHAAELDGSTLPVDQHRAPPTPWDAELQAAFDGCRRVVHEERLIAELLS